VTRYRVEYKNYQIWESLGESKGRVVYLRVKRIRLLAWEEFGLEWHIYFVQLSSALISPAGACMKRFGSKILMPTHAQTPMGIWTREL
jgi:hypothetical protein